MTNQDLDPSWMLWCGLEDRTCCGWNPELFGVVRRVWRVAFDAPRFADLL